MKLRTINNIAERKFIGRLLSTVFRPPVRMSSIEWGIKRRTVTSEESTIAVGKFNPLLNPVMEYVYECLDSPYIPIITSRKPARIGWTEVINTYLGKRIEIDPCNILYGFPTKAQVTTFAKGKWATFVRNVPVLKEIIDKNIAKSNRSMYESFFDGGELRLRTLGAISTVKSDNLPLIGIEEPDDTKEDLSGQGDLLAILAERQKMVPKTRRKLIYGGTPTNKDFSKVDKGILASNQLVFKAECHNCKELIPMDGKSFECFTFLEYEGRRIDEVYGKYDPSTVKFNCPSCGIEWSFEQKNKNLIEGKKYGFTDHTGNFSKGWHPKKPEITDNFGFIFSELMSPFEGSSFEELAKAIILAERDLSKGKEGLMKSLYNNKRGESYASGFSAMEVEDMIALRSNYPEKIVQAEGLVLTMGIDVQRNRFAIVVMAWGRNGNCWLVNWLEIFGNVQNPEDPVWDDLTNYALQNFQHVSGKLIPISGIGIDCGDGVTTELVYRWVNMMNLTPEFNGQVRACKGVRELKFSQDDIYRDPPPINQTDYGRLEQTIFERYGIRLFIVGTHRAQDEILRRLSLNQVNECRQDRFYFCETEYGGFEEQILSCRKIIDVNSNYQKEVYKLVSGQRKEAMDCCKLALHSMIAIGLREYTNEHWKQLENYYFR